MEQTLSGNKVLSVVNDEPFWKLMKAESGSSGEQLWFLILHERFSQKPEIVESFFRMAEKSIVLKHPNITKVLRFESEENLHFIVMEPFLGEPLTAFIEKNGPLDEVQVMTIAVQLCQAIQYAKLSGTMHGCLTADSIFINSNLEISIINFGCDQFVEKALPLLDQEEAVRYARYLSPKWGDEEEEEEPALMSNDLYGIGTILYYLLSGCPAYHEESLEFLIASQQNHIPLIREKNKNISKEMEDIIIRLLGHDPHRPFHSVTELVRLLAPETVSKDALPDPSVIDEPFTVREKLQRYLDRLPPVLGLLIPTWVGVKRRVAVTVAAAIAVVVAAILIFVFSHENISETAELAAYYQENLSERNTVVTDEPSVIEPTPVQSEPLIAVEQPIEQSPVDEKTAENEAGAATDVPGSGGEALQSELPVLNQEPVQQPQVAPLDSAGGEFRIHVEVSGMPVQATVYVGEEAIGTTNPQGDFVVAGAQPGASLDLRVEKAGFQAWGKKLKIDQANQFGIAVTLFPEPTAIRRFAIKEVGFADRVIIDNKLPSYKLPTSVDLAPGPHLFRYIESASMFSLDTTLFLDMENKPEVFVDAASLGVGTLSVVVENAFQVGYAYVSLDGEEKLETTPFRRQLPAGRHQLILFREGYTSTPQDTSIIVLPNRETVVRCRLEKNP